MLSTMGQAKARRAQDWLPHSLNTGGEAKFRQIFTGRRLMVRASIDADKTSGLTTTCTILKGANMKPDVSKITEAVLGVERSANERWNNGDCNGYIEAYSEGITYFDPATEKVLVGRKDVEAHIRKLYKNPHIVRSEYRNPEITVSDDGNLAVLSYNLRNYV